MQDGFGGSASSDHVDDALAHASQAASNPATYSGTWSITKVRTWAALYFLDEGVAGADGDPEYGGPAAGDVNPRAIGILFYEVADAGAVATASMGVSAGVGSASCSCSTTLSGPIAIYYDASIAVTVDANGASGTGTGSTGDDWLHCGPPTLLTKGDAGGERPVFRQLGVGHGGRRHGGRAARLPAEPRVRGRGPSLRGDGGLPDPARPWASRACRAGRRRASS